MKKEYYTSQVGIKKKIGGGAQGIRAQTGQYLYTKGKEYTAQDGTEYIGEYYVGQDGNPYQGPSAKIMGNPLKTIKASKKKKARLLLPYYESDDTFVYDRNRKANRDKLIKGYATPSQVEYKVQPELGVYKIGYDTRYFVQKRGTGTWAVEVGSRQFELFGTRGGPDPGLYAWTTIRWQLVGTLDFIERSNKKAVSLAAREVPGIRFVIRNYLQGASITNQTTADYSSLIHRNQLTPQMRELILATSEFKTIDSYGK